MMCATSGSYLYEEPALPWPSLSPVPVGTTGTATLVLEMEAPC